MYYVCMFVEITIKSNLTIIIIKYEVNTMRKKKKIMQGISKKKFSQLMYEICFSHIIQYASTNDHIC